MRRYVSGKEADRILGTEPVLSYPNYDYNLSRWPILDGKVHFTRQSTGEEVEYDLRKPGRLVVESMHILGNEPKRILDLGCDDGSNSIYLAAQGHEVTAMDSSPRRVEEARENARELGIPDKNFIPRIGDIRTLPSYEKYDCVVAAFVLHFLTGPESRKALELLDTITLPEGLNITNAYTDDNPAGEMNDRGLKHFFSTDELSNAYPGNIWTPYRSTVGLHPAKVPRNVDKYLIPTVAEIIAKKTPLPRVVGRTALGTDHEFLRRLDPEYYGHLVDSGLI